MMKVGLILLGLMAVEAQVVWQPWQPGEPVYSPEKTGTPSRDPVPVEWGLPISEEELKASRSVLAEEPTPEVKALVENILETESHVTSRREGARAVERPLSARWPNNVVPYRIDVRFSP